MINDSFFFSFIETVYNGVLAFDNVDCGNVDEGISVNKDLAYLV